MTDSQESSLFRNIIVTIILFKTMTFAADKGYCYVVRALYKIKISLERPGSRKDEKKNSLRKTILQLYSDSQCLRNPAENVHGAGPRSAVGRAPDS